MRSDCRGREDCSQEELVILRCKYFLPDCKKKACAYGRHGCLVQSGFSWGRGCILNANCPAMQGGQRRTVSLIPSIFMLSTSRLLRSPDLQTPHIGL